MKKSVLLLLAATTCAFGQNNFKAVNHAAKTSLNFNLERYEVKTHTETAGKYITAPEAVFLLQKDAPEVMKFTSNIEIANTGKPEISNVVATEYNDIPNVNLLPSKGSLKRNVDPAEIPFVYGEAYTKNEFFPKKLVEITEPFILRNKRGVTVITYPFQYNPVTKVLRVYKNVNFDITCNNKNKGANEISNAARFSGPDVFNSVYPSVFINAKGTQPNSPQYSQISENGRMLVISASTLLGAIQPLVDWKIQKGIEVDVTDIASIGNTESAIFAYIQNYYAAHPDFTFLLLVGDHQQIKSGNMGQTSTPETKWSDTRYAFLSGTDYFPEILVGRFSANNVSEASTMVNRNLEYEKNPLSGAWLTTSLGLASNQGAGQGDNGEADWEHMRFMRDTLLNYGYTQVHEFYDGSHGGADAANNPTNSMVATAVNAGTGLFIYCGHGSQNACVTSNYNSTNVWNATNNSKYPFVISVACNNGTFDSGTCLMEDFERANNANGPTGAIAGAGSSILMAWAEPMPTEDEIVDILTENKPGNIKQTIGGLFYNGQMRMLEKYPTNDGEEVMQTWVFFGDPSTVIRCKLPQQMAISHQLCYTSSTTNLAVNGSLNGALASLTVNGTILATAAVTGGVATLNFTPQTGTDSLLLTVTGYNQYPYQKYIKPCATGITANEMGFVNVFPNPAENALTVALSNGNTIKEIKIMNALGQFVAVPAIAGLTDTQVDVSGLAKGMYKLVLTDNNNTTLTRTFIKQ